MKRTIAVIALGAAALLGADEKKPVRSKQTGRASASKPDAKAPAKPAMRVYIDPVTGEMTSAPPGSEGSTAAAAAEPGPVIVNNPDGSKTAILGSQFMQSTVATICEDGKIRLSEVSGNGQALQEAKKQEAKK